MCEYKALYCSSACFVCVLACACVKARFFSYLPIRRAILELIGQLLPIALNNPRVRLRRSSLLRHRQRRPRAINRLALCVTQVADAHPSDVAHLKVLVGLRDREDDLDDL